MIKFGGPKTLPPQIVTYPSYGFETRHGDWLINVRGILFQTPPFTLRQKMLLKMLTGVMKASESEINSENFQDRVWPFFVDGQRGHKIRIEIGDQNFLLRKKSRRNGRFDEWLRLSDSLVRETAPADDRGRRYLKFSLITGHPESPGTECEVELLGSLGVSIVSDIDDTIKESHVGNRRELLMNTFVREFRSVDGMADVYEQWRQSGAGFHYVSSSPWQLFDSLASMRQDFGFPNGTMHLRNFRLRDQLLTKLMFKRKGKALEIRKLVRNLPQRKFILVGDSGEKDPEIYQKVRRKYPDQVKAIFIRDLADQPMDAERRNRLQRSCLPGHGGTFNTAEELAGLAEPLLEQYSDLTTAKC